MATAFSANAETYDEERLIESIAYHESRHQDDLVSKNGEYVGCLQISRIAVRECNRILGYKAYRYEDRKDKQKSIEMFRIIQRHHNPEGDIVNAIRLWSEGTTYRSHPTKRTGYLRKVLRRYNRKK